MVLVVPPSHDWADQEVEVDALKQQPLLMREFGSGSRRAIVAAGLQKKDLKIQKELDSTEGLLSAVEAGLGVTIVSRWAVRNQLSLGTLKIARVRGLKLLRQFSIAYPAGPVPTGNARAFHRFLLSRSSDLARRPTGKHPNVRAVV